MGVSAILFSDIVDVKDTSFRVQASGVGGQGSEVGTSGSEWRCDVERQSG